MKKSKKRALYIVAALLAVVFVLACLAGFAACGGDEAEVESVSLNSTSLSIEEGKSATVTASVKMSDDSAYSGSYAWTTSDSSVATVSGSGVTGTVTAVKAGSATITVTVDDGFTATCSVTVTAAAPSATLLATLSGTAQIDSGYGFNLSGDVTMMLYSDGSVSLSVDISGTVTPYSAIYTIDDSGNITLTIGSYTPDTGTVVYDADGTTILAIELTSFTGVTQNVTFAVEGYTPETGGDEGGDENPGTGTEPDPDPTPDPEPEPEATQVSTADALVAALETGGEIDLAADIAASSTLTVSADTTIDLAGYTLSSGTTTTTTDETTGETTTTTSGWTPVSAASNGVVSDVMISVGEGASLTIEDSSEEETGTIAYTYVGPTVYNVFGSTTYDWNKAGNHGAAIMVDGNENTSVTIESGTISSSSVGIRAKNGSVEINGGVIYSSGYYVIWEDTGTTDVTINDGLIYGDWGGILVDGDSRFKGSYSEGAVTTLIVNGGVVYSGGTANSAIRTENQGSTDSAIIKITGGLVYCADVGVESGGDSTFEAGIFIGNGTLEITGGTIVGPTAVEIQGGKATISGGTIISNATGNQSIQSVSSSDPFSYGYALAIYPRTSISSGITGWTAAISVTISGGTFYGDVYVAAKAYDATNDEGGTWSLGGSNYSVSIKNVGSDVIISGKLVMTNTETGKDVVADSDATWGNYDRVIGKRGNDDNLYYMGDVAFDGSEAAATLSDDGYTWVISGTSASMTDEQLKAYWVTDDTTGLSTDYIAIAIIAGAGETVTTTTSDGTLVSTTNGGTAGKAQPIVINVTDYDAETSDFYLSVIVTDSSTGALKAAYVITLGTITAAATTEPQG